MHGCNVRLLHSLVPLVPLKCGYLQVQDCKFKASITRDAQCSVRSEQVVSGLQLLMQSSLLEVENEM